MKNRADAIQRYTHPRSRTLADLATTCSEKRFNAAPLYAGLHRISKDIAECRQMLVAEFHIVSIISITRGPLGQRKGWIGGRPDFVEMKGKDTKKAREARGHPGLQRIEKAQAALWSLIAFSTRGGDMGTWVRRTPAAFEIALPMAPSGGTIEVSPTPRTP